MLPKRIKEQRLKKDLNQEELGKLLNVTKQTVSGWENGYRSPDIDTLSKLSDIFKCTTDYLLGKTEDITSEVVSFEQEGNTYKIELEKGTKEQLTEGELQELIKRLEAVNFDVKKLIEKIKEEENER